MSIAIFTLLYDTGYLPGSLLLGSILKDMIKDHQLQVSLGILIDKSVFNDDQISLLNEVYDDLVDIAVIKSSLNHKLVHDINRPELDKTYSKVHLWNLPYTKVLYLDSDTLPNPTSNLLDLLKIDFHESKILASPDSGFPDIFNSGMFVIKPNKSDYKNLVQLVESEQDVSFDGADQGLLNQYFNSDPDWVGNAVASSGTPQVSHKTASSSNWVPLPFLYNVTPNTQYQYAPAYSYFSSTTVNPLAVGKILPPDPDTGVFGGGTIETPYGYTASKHYGNKVKLIHYIGPQKPWKYPYNPSHAEWWTLWHKYYDHNTLDATKKSAGSSEYTTKDSLWDPAVSSPPKEASSPKPVSIPTKFTSSWDRDAKPKKPILRNSTRSSPKQSSQQAINREREKQSVYGFHPFQKPERVFSESHDYVPTLPDISKLKKQQKPHPYSSSVDVDEVNEKLANLGLDK